MNCIFRAVYYASKNCVTVFFDFVLPRSEYSVASISDVAHAQGQALPIFDHKRGVYYLLPYRHPYIKDLFWSIKFKHNKHAAQLLGSFVWSEVPTLAKDLLVTVPTTHKRIQARGFDQVHEIARGIVSVAGGGIEYIPNILQKDNRLDPQSWNKNKSTRSLSIAHAFVVRKPEVVRGRTILLLDDIVTTGSTINEAKRVLLEAGAKQVVCLAVAH